MNRGRTSKYLVENNSTQLSQNWICASYKRLSREDGDKLESDSISTQQAIIDRLVSNSLDLKIFDSYTDDGYTGTNFNRPEFQRMMNDIKLGKINCIIVKDLSRLGRNYYEMGEFLEVIVPLMRIRFISINDRIDSFKNPKSLKNAAVAFKNVMNDEYCRDTSNKVRSALTAKRKRGQFIGSFACYGYIKDPTDKHKLIVDEHAASVVQLIFKSFLEGKSMLSISRMLNSMGELNPTKYKESIGLNVNRKCANALWDQSAVRRILKNEVYIGNLVQRQMETISYKVQILRAVEKEKQIRVQNTHQAIVELDTFNKVQELLTRDTRTSPKDSNLSILAGYVKCADCKRSMTKKTIVQPYKTYAYYVCSTYRKQHQCSKHTIQIDDVEKAVLAVIQHQVALAMDIEHAIDVINNSPVKNFATQRISNALEKKQLEKEKTLKFLNELYPDMKNGLISMEQYLAYKDSRNSKLDEINADIDRLKRELEDSKSGADGVNSFVSSFVKHKNIVKLTREVIVELIEMIYIKEGGGIEIQFKFLDSYEKAIDYINENAQIIAKLNIAGNSLVRVQK